MTTAEELHCLALFGRVDDALSFGELVGENYTGPVNNPDKFGDQIYLDEEENILGEVEINLAQGASSLGLSELGGLIRGRGGSSSSPPT